jgi:hypothetical protein
MIPYQNKMMVKPDQEIGQASFFIAYERSFSALLLTGRSSAVATGSIAYSTFSKTFFSAGIAPIVGSCPFF